MNTPNPLVPQGSLPSRGKSTVRIAFFTIAAIHVVFIGGLLMQGCKKPENKPVVEDTAPPPLPPLTNDVAVVDNAYAPAAPSDPSVTSNTVEQAPEPLPQAPIAPAAADPAREYVVEKGDSFYSIAKKSNTSIKAIQEANPGVSSTKLKVGQKLQVPAGGSASSASAPAEAYGSSSSTDNGTTYVVKAGDMLERIARRHGTSAKAIMQKNNLRTTMIKPGQKLKIPSNGKSSGGPVAGSGYVTPLPTP